MQRKNVVESAKIFMENLYSTSNPKNFAMPDGGLPGQLRALEIEIFGPQRATPSPAFGQLVDIIIFVGAHSRTTAENVRSLLEADKPGHFHSSQLLNLASGLALNAPPDRWMQYEITLNQPPGARRIEAKAKSEIINASFTSKV